MDWQKFDITSELIICGVIFLAWHLSDKDIILAVVSGLIGYLTRKAQG